MAQFLNVQTGKPEDLGASESAEALAKGTHVPTGGARALVDPEGKLVISPAEEAYDNVQKYGYKVPTQGDLDEFAGKEKYGRGTGNELKAGLAGAARGATFGLSDEAMTHSGLVKPETLKGLQDYNPAASIGGEIAGAVGSAMIGDEAAPAALVEKLGSKVASKLAPEALGEGASLAAKVLNSAGQVGAKAAGSAVEGAFYGLGQSVSEDALGDPQALGEKLIANVTMGGLYGGAAGGLLKAGELAMPKAYGAAKNAVSGAWRKLFGGEIPAAADAAESATSAAPETASQMSGLADTAEPAGDASPIPESQPRRAPLEDEVPPPKGSQKQGENPYKGLDYEDGIIPRIIAKVKEAGGGDGSEVLESFRNRAAKEGEALNPKERAQFVRETVGALQDSYSAAETASRESFAKARPQETAALLQGADPAVGHQAGENILQRLNEVTTEMERRPALYPARFPAKLQEIAADFNTELFHGETAAEKFQAIDNLKKMLDDRINWKREISGDAADAVNLVKQVRGEARRALEDERIWGEAAARQAHVNEATTNYLASQKEFQKRFMTKTVQKGKSVWTVEPRKVNEFFNMINEPRGEIRAQALSEHLQNTRALVDQLEQTHQHAPISSFDPAELRGQLAGNEGQIDRARNMVSSQPGQGYGFFTSLFLGHTLGGPMATVATVAKHMADPHILANLERATKKTEGAVSRISKAVFKPVGDSLKKGAGVVKDRLSPEDKVERIKKNMAEVEQRVSSPENLAEEVHQATKDGYHVAPKTMAAVQQTAIQGAQFLASKLPKRSAPQMPLDKPYEPSKTELTKWDRYYQAVHDPVGAFEQLASGAMHPEAKEALETVFPALTGEMKTHLMDELTTRLAKGETLPTQRRLSLERFLGTPLGSSSTPQSLAMTQQALRGAAAKKAAQETAQGGAVHPSQKGMASLTISNRMSTSLDGTAQRERA